MSDADKVVVLATDPFGAARARLEGRMLVVPNERAAAALLGRRAQVPTLTVLAESVLRRAGLSIAGELSGRRLLRALIAERLEAVDPVGSLRRLEPVVNELLRAGVGAGNDPYERLEAAEVSGRTIAVVGLAVAFDAALSRRGEVAPAATLWHAAAAIRDGAVPGDGAALPPLLVAGYPRLGAGEVAIIAALAEPGTAVVLPHGFASSEVTARALSAHGFTRVNASERETFVGPDAAARFAEAVYGGPSLPAAGDDLIVVRPDDEEAEVRHALAHVAGLLTAGARPGDIVIVARDERAYGPLVTAVAAEFGVPLGLGFGHPLAETRLGGLLSYMCAAAAGRLRFEETARVLRHGLVRALPEEAWVAARAGHPVGPAAWTAVGAAAIEHLVWPARGTWPEMTARLAEAVTALGASERLTVTERAALEWLLAELGAIGPTPEVTGTVSIAAFAEAVDEALATVMLPGKESGPERVDFHTPLAVFGARYEHVVVLGMVEGGFPRAVKDDPVIDFFERRALAAVGVGLEDPEGAAEREELSFHAVLSSARRGLMLCSPSRLAGKEQVPSPYLSLLLSPEPRRPDLREPVGATETLLATLPQVPGPARTAWEVELRRESAEPADDHDGVTGRSVSLIGRRLSATQLTTFGQCAFRWFGTYVLNVAAPVEAEDEVSALTTGAIFHGTLERAVRLARAELADAQLEPEPRGSPAGSDAGSVGEGRPASSGAGAVGEGGPAGSGLDPFRRAVTAHLPRAYDEANAELEAAGRPVRALTWPKQRGENLEKLRRLVASADFIAEGARVVAQEAAFAGRWRGLDVSGRVDRIDLVPTPEGDTLVLTDYKLRKTPPEGAKGAGGRLDLDVQLPLYLETATAPDHPGVPVGQARYLSVNAAKVSRLVDDDTIDSEGLDALVARFVAAAERGDFPLDPDAARSACSYCDHALACRIGPRLGRKPERRAGAQGSSR